MQWLIKLLPKQKMQHVGDGNVQAGRVEGDLNHTQNNSTHNVYNTYLMFSAETSVVEAKPGGVVVQPPGVPVKKVGATSEQHDLLRLMRQSPANEARAEAFMLREFKTDRVKRLRAFECLRTMRYVEACIKRDLAKFIEENQ